MQMIFCCQTVVWVKYEGASATTAFLQPRSDLMAISCSVPPLFFCFCFFFCFHKAVLYI